MKKKTFGGMEKKIKIKDKTCGESYSTFPTCFRVLVNIYILARVKKILRIWRKF
jgi:hypothetical protein